MLLSKSKFSVGDITSFKLGNGDELIAKITDITDDAYILSRPCLVIPNQQGIGLMQAMFSVDPDGKIEVNRAHIMMQGETVEQLQNHYIKTTTGIEPITRGGIIV